MLYSYDTDSVIETNRNNNYNVRNETITRLLDVADIVEDIKKYR
jgi:hypothetical protein